MSGSTLNHHYWTCSDYLLTTYMVMLTNCAVRVMIMVPAFNHAWQQHIIRLACLRYDTIPEYVQPAQVFQLSDYRNKA